MNGTGEDEDVTIPEIPLPSVQDEFIEENDGDPSTATSNNMLHL